MNFKMVHTEVHVLDLDASLAFYKEALGLEPVREKGPEDGSWKIVFLENDQTDFQLELTWTSAAPSPMITAAETFTSRLPWTITTRRLRTIPRWVAW